MIDLPHFEDGDPQKLGPMTVKFKLGRYFCTMNLLIKFNRSMFNRSEVTVLTNKQRDSVENIHLSLLCYTGVE